MNIYNDLQFTCPINAKHKDCAFNHFREIPHKYRRIMAWKELSPEDKIYYISLYHSCAQKTICGSSQISQVS